MTETAIVLLIASSEYINGIRRKGGELALLEKVRRRLPKNATRLRRSWRGLLMRVIAGPHKGAGFDVAETHLESFGFELGELARRVEARHRQVVREGRRYWPMVRMSQWTRRGRGRPQAARGLFAEADHDSGFSDAGGFTPWRSEEFEGALVAGAGAHHTIKARTDSVLWLRTSGRASTTV